MAVWTGARQEWDDPIGFECKRGHLSVKTGQMLWRGGILVQQTTNIVPFCQGLFKDRIARAHSWPHKVEDRWGKKACLQEQAWSGHRSTNSAEDSTGSGSSRPLSWFYIQPLISPRCGIWNKTSQVINWWKNWNPKCSAHCHLVSPSSTVLTWNIAPSLGLNPWEDQHCLASSRLAFQSLCLAIVIIGLCNWIV